MLTEELNTEIEQEVSRVFERLLVSEPGLLRFRGVSKAQLEEIGLDVLKKAGAMED